MTWCIDMQAREWVNVKARSRWLGSATARWHWQASRFLLTVSAWDADLGKEGLVSPFPPKQDCFPIYLAVLPVCFLVSLHNFPLLYFL